MWQKKRQFIPVPNATNISPRLRQQGWTADLAVTYMGHLSRDKRKAGPRKLTKKQAGKRRAKILPYAILPLCFVLFAKSEYQCFQIEHFMLLIRDVFIVFARRISPSVTAVTHSALEEKRINLYVIHAQSMEKHFVGILITFKFLQQESGLNAFYRKNP